MLLRRISEHVKAQNWFAVFLDFLIVVIGVFIGIQVANWNEARSEAVREHQALEAILKDLKVDRNALQSSLDMAEVNLTATNYLLEKAGYKGVDQIAMPVANAMLGATTLEVPEPKPIPDDEKKFLWKRITIQFYATQSNAALGALIAAGDLDLIKDSDLVQEIQHYVSLWSMLHGSSVTTFRTFRDQVVLEGQKLGLSPFVEIEEQELLTLVKGKLELIGAIRTLQEYSILRERQTELLHQRTDNLIQRIESKLSAES